MGTKNEPGKYDCYNKLEPDEPYFVLMARDEYAPLLIRLWAAMREADGDEDKTKVQEARDCAWSMTRWRLNSGRMPVSSTLEALARIIASWR